MEDINSINVVYDSDEVCFGELQLSESATTSKPFCRTHSQTPDLGGRGGGWSELLNDLLDQIKGNLLIPDLIRFGCVSPSWRSSSYVLGSKFFHHKSRLPWLIVPYLGHYNDNPALPPPGAEDNYCRDGVLGFFSILDRATYKIEVPELHGHRICVSSFGWLITLCAENSEMQLFHPFTKKVVTLPSLTKFPDVRGTCFSEEQGLVYHVNDSIRDPNFIVDFNINHMRDNYIYKVIAFPSHPHSSTPPLVVAIPTVFMKLHFCRPGKDDSWTRIDIQGRYNYSDFTLFNGDFYALGYEGELDVIKGLLDDLSPTSSLLLMPSKEYRDDMVGHNSYLVVSSNELFQVIMHLSDEDNGDYQITERFNVFKVDFSGPKWVVVKDLGDEAFFVGSNHSFSVAASDFPGCRRNCIYFCDDNMDHLYTGHDKGIFCLDDSSIEKNCPIDMDFICPRPLWYSLSHTL